MPTYDYMCEGCRHAFEQFQSITAKPLQTCPSCGQPRLRRLIGTGAGVLFKGSGFYETDYRSDSYRKAAKAERDAAAPGGGSSTGGGNNGDGAKSTPDNGKGATADTPASNTGSSSTAGKPAAS